MILRASARIAAFGKNWKWKLKNDRLQKVQDLQFQFPVSEREVKNWIAEKYNTTSRNIVVWPANQPEPKDPGKQTILIAIRLREEPTQWILEGRLPKGSWIQIGMADRDSIDDLKDIMKRKETIEQGKDSTYRMR